MNATLRLFGGLLLIVVMYFFSFQLQKILGAIGHKFSEKIGTASTSREFAIQRYVYLHRRSLISRFYLWVNEQLIALGVKRLGVTPVGYITFWGFISIAMSVVLTFAMGLDFSMMLICTGILFFVCMTMTRVLVAERMERREADVMDAIDLIIPQVGGGVKNAILMYIDNFAPSLQADFKAFVSNIQDRGMSFAEAMFILSDNLGLIFKDFAQKAVYFENLGEPDMIDIFADIVESNRLRRELRYTNGVKFNILKSSFIASSVITFGYFCFLLLTDEFSKYFFLTTYAGRILLIVILLVVFCVLSYITTIKSRQI